MQVQLQDNLHDPPPWHTLPVAPVKYGNCRAIPGPLDCGVFSGFPDYMANWKL